MEFTYGINDDYLDDDDDGVMYSTRTYSSESDEESTSVFTLSSKSQKKKSERKASSAPEQDDFEKEMAAELNATVRILTANASTSSGSKNEGNKDTNDSEYYDRIYFDSDESSSDEGDDSSPQNASGTKRKNKHRILTNDELLYDPLMDDADQAWVDSNRRSYQVKRQRSLTRKGEYKHQPLPQSDAVLNCPACFTTLCLDCQRHEIYKNQYRAMFVFNCVVDKSEILHFAVKEDKKKKFKNRKNNKQENGSASASKSESVANTGDSNEVPENIQGSEDTFHPVKCTICSTKVGVQDQDEVHHFFNVLTSY